MVAPYSPRVVSVAVTNGNLVVQTEDGATATSPLPTAQAGAATGTSTAITLPTQTSSYARPLNDMLGEAVHVACFVPAGTALTAVTDWGPIWNAALNECRAIVNAGGRFHLIGPNLTQNVLTTINGTGIASFGSTIDFRSGLFILQTTGKAGFDFMGCWFLSFYNLSFQGGQGGSGANTTNIPSIGFQWGRAIPNSNADTNNFYNVKSNGAFGLTAWYCNAAESNGIFGGWLSNNVDPAHMTGVVSVAGTPVAGAAPIAFGLICDALGHWQVPTLLSGGNQFPPETATEQPYVSFEQFKVVSTTISCGSGPALWISSGTNHNFDDVYIECGAQDALVHWYRRDNDSPENFRFRWHCEEGSSTGYSTLFKMIGDVDVGAAYCNGLEIYDGGSVTNKQVFQQALSTPNTVMQFFGCRIQISKVVVSGGGTGASLFDNPQLYQTEGDIDVPGYAWNSVWDTGLGYGHSGHLGLNNGSSKVSSYGGNILFGGALAPAAIATALAALGITITNDAVGSVKITGGGNYYTATQSGAAAYTPTATFSAPPSPGTTATGTVALALAGLGINGSNGGGTGYTTATGLAIKDGAGNTLPFTVNITATNGVIQSVAYSSGTTTASTVPQGPFTVVQTGGSGSLIYAVYTVTGVTVTAGGSGYQSAAAPPSVTFSGANAAPTASGTVVMAGAITVGSVTTNKATY